MVQSIHHILHQIILIYKTYFISFLLKHSPYKREPERLSISQLTHFSFSSLMYYINSKIKAFSFSSILSFFTDIILCPQMLLFYFFLKKFYSLFRNKIKYYFLSEAIYDFPRIVNHSLYYHPKESVHTLLWQLQHEI